MAQTTTPRTLQQAVVYFSDPQRAFDFAVSLRWPDGKVICPRCSGSKHSFIKTRRIWFCYDCKKQFTVKVKTVFEDSALPLDKWMVAVWMLVACKNGISSYELARDVKVQQKTAWFMLQRIRLAMQHGTFDKPMGSDGGEVEADETFIGGKARFMHAHKREKKITGTGGSGKELVVGILDRETGKVRIEHIADRKKKTLHAHIREHVEPGAQLMTDELASYTGLDKDYVHQVINHAESYVRGNVHTQGLDNFWSLLKRSIKGTYVSVEPFHLFRYLDEQAFRYNERKHQDGDAGRFADILSGVTGKRLMYKELTGKVESAPTAAPVMH